MKILMKLASYRNPAKFVWNENGDKWWQKNGGAGLTDGEMDERDPYEDKDRKRTLDRDQTNEELKRELKENQEKKDAKKAERELENDHRKQKQVKEKKKTEAGWERAAKELKKKIDHTLAGAESKEDQEFINFKEIVSLYSAIVNWTNDFGGKGILEEEVEDLKESIDSYYAEGEEGDLSKSNLMYFVKNLAKDRYEEIEKNTSTDQMIGENTSVYYKEYWERIKLRF